MEGLCPAGAFVRRSGLVCGGVKLIVSILAHNWNQTSPAKGEAIKYLLPCPYVRKFVKHGFETDKNCGRVAAGIYSGGESARRHVSAECARGKIMLWQERALLQYGVLRRAPSPFCSCCACACPFRFSK
jgi:hypothetical protein